MQAFICKYNILMQNKYVPQLGFELMPNIVLKIDINNTNNLEHLPIHSFL